MNQRVSIPMKRLLFITAIVIFSCKSDKQNDNDSAEKKESPIEFKSVSIEPVLENDSLSIRAIELMGTSLGFAANKGFYGLYNAQNRSMQTKILEEDGVAPEFRAVASTDTDFFLLSIGSPALLYKTGDSGQMDLVYRENDETVFYDAMAFWNEKEGIAMGDPTESCLSVIITRNGGANWEKIPCENLPEAAKGEAAFAASNSNIAIQGDKTWLLSGGVKSRIYYSEDKGETWEVFDTPLIQGSETTGGYSMDFYDENIGIIIGGDYTKPEDNSKNKAITSDGGKTWKLIADGGGPGYKGSVRFVPGGEGKHIVAVEASGISYSADAGKTWNEISKEGFYTIRFIDENTAYAAGKGRIAILEFY